MPYQIFVQELAASEIEAIRSFDQRRILDAIEEQLSHQPNVPTRRRKCLMGLTPEFEHVEPIWELRVGNYRVFYDVNEDTLSVHVRAVRLKEPRQHTRDIT